MLIRRFSIILVVLLTACSTATQFGAIASDIELVSKTTSPFDETIYSGERVEHNENTGRFPEYRIYHKGASGFVSRTSVRNSALKRVEEFCAKQKAEPKIIYERRSTSAPIPGNFPRVEFVFVCEAYKKTEVNLSPY